MKHVLYVLTQIEGVWGYQIKIRMKLRAVCEWDYGCSRTVTTVRQEEHNLTVRKIVRIPPTISS